MSVFYTLIIRHICYMSIDGWKMLCSILHPNNNGQQYFVSGFVHYINPGWCDRGLSNRTHTAVNLHLCLPLLVVVYAHIVEPLEEGWVCANNIQLCSRLQQLDLCQNLKLLTLLVEVHLTGVVCVGDGCVDHCQVR